MDRMERLALVEGFETAYELIDTLLQGLGKDALTFVPPFPGAWSINDFLVHLLDADAAVWFRIRTAVAEPGATIPVWDEEAWQGKLRYGAMDGRACLDLAKGLRAAAASSLRSLADEDWDGYSVVHPARGRLGLTELLLAYREHVAFHAPLVKRNRDAWKKSGSLKP